AALIDAMAYEEPVVLVLDDLHLASTSTLDLVAYLSNRLRHSPVLLILVARADGSNEAGLSRLRSMAVDADGLTNVVAFTSLPLESTASIVRDYLEAHAPGKSLDDSRLAAFADGNPL